MSAHTTQQTMNETQELFQPAAVASDSPRIAWCRRYRIIISDMTTQPVAAAAVATGEIDRWWCESDKLQFPMFGSGPTEADAIADFARRNGLRLWNEEVPQRP